MRNYNNIQNVFFIGIGGIGMSALARYFAKNGKQVAGYDKTPSPITGGLQQDGIPVFFDENRTLLDAGFSRKKETLVVYTPAVAAKNKWFAYFRENGFLLKKRAQVLGGVTKGKQTLAVAGTHGKTTTTAILAHLLKESGVKLTAFLGGISENYQTNFLLDGEEAIVVEADEFDRSFLQLFPTMAAITSMDADHLDIYGENEQLQQSFRDFANLLPDPEKLFVKNGLPLNGKSIGVDDDADFSAKNIAIQNGRYKFDLQTPKSLETGFEFALPGKHNLQNAVTALAMALDYGTPVKKLTPALATFKGVQRRFTYLIKSENFVLIDDYAHHPAEIDAVHQAIREMYPGKKALAVFQPHLYSRTRDFADDFAKSLAQFDEILLLEIYPAREKPISGVNAAFLLKKIPHQNKKSIEKPELSNAIKKSNCFVVAMMGAGDIGEEVQKVAKNIQCHEK